MARSGHRLKNACEMPRYQKYAYVLQAFARYSGPVADSRQGGTLADTHEGKPGLPRGRSRLPVVAVQASQRERLVRAVVAAVAQSGYPAVTVADIVRRARVSRAAFYTHFTGKEDCFLSASQEGGKLMVSRIVTATRALAPGTPDEEVLRVACRAFLAFVGGEPEFAKIFYIDMPAAGPRAWERLDAAQHRYAVLNRTWHERALVRHPDWPAVPYEAYLALAGATAELVRARVRQGDAGAIPGLEDTIVSLHLAVMAGRRWEVTRLGTPGRADPEVGALTQHRQHRVRGHHHVRKVDRFGQGLERAEAARTAHAGSPAGGSVASADASASSAGGPADSGGTSADSGGVSLAPASRSAPAPAPAGEGAGRKHGRFASAIRSTVICTRMPIWTLPGSAPTIRVIMRTPSSRSTRATMNGA